jgi:hypothetical protein
LTIFGKLELKFGFAIIGIMRCRLWSRECLCYFVVSIHIEIKVIKYHLFLFFLRTRFMCCLPCQKKAITCVLSCYSTPCFDTKEDQVKPPCVLTENLYPVLSCCLIVPSLKTY